MTPLHPQLQRLITCAEHRMHVIGGHLLHLHREEAEPATLSRHVAEMNKRYAVDGLLWLCGRNVVRRDRG